MIIIDTSIWINLFRGDETILRTVDALIDNDSVIGLEPIFAELLQGTKNKNELKFIKQYWSDITKTDEKDLWLEAGLTSSKNKWLSQGIGLIDAFIITVAWQYNFKIWTLDKKLGKAAGKDFIYLS